MLSARPQRCAEQSACRHCTLRKGQRSNCGYVSLLPSETEMMVAKNIAIPPATT